MDQIPKKEDFKNALQTSRSHTKQIFPEIVQFRHLLQIRHVCLKFRKSVFYARRGRTKLMRGAFESPDPAALNFGLNSRIRLCGGDI